MKIVDVTCAIISIESKVLAVQRSSNMKLPLKWEFAGGKVEKGESESDCIKREILEELNINIEITKRLTPVIHKYSDIRIRLIPFTAQYLTGELKLKEHVRYVLVSKSELIKLDWAEADLPILNEFLQL